MLAKKIKCFKCGKTYSPQTIIFECDECGYSLDVQYDYKLIKKMINRNFFYQIAPSHWKYWAFYPVKDLQKVVSMQEGGTPLIQSKKNKNYFFKYEGCNPTGVFKDRGPSIEITKAAEFGVKKVICASTGNMGASVSAYAQRAGIKAEIFVPTFAEKQKLRQIKAYGAKVTVMQGTYDDVLEHTQKLREKTGVYLTGDYPYRAEGQKSVGFEIIDQLNWKIPENIVVPIGNGTLIWSVYKACFELKETGFIKKIPKIIGVQAKGCNPVVNAFKKGKNEVKALKKTKTIASAINCNNPVDGMQALHAIRKSKGNAVEVSDAEILKAQKELGEEGIFAETSGAVSFAGAKKLKLKGKTVIVVTATGLKEA